MTSARARAILTVMDGTRDISGTLYERDFAAWAEAQAHALRAGDHGAVDWANVIEEIETLGRSERSKMSSAILRILEHRLKLDHGLNDEPKRGWIVTIRKHQRILRKTLKENPSLKRDVPNTIVEEYADARDAALDSFYLYEDAHIGHYRAALPEICSYDRDDVLG